MNQYISVFHWEGYETEPPVFLQAESLELAEESLLRAATNQVLLDEFHLHCDEPTSAHQYVSDYFHIDILMPAENLRLLKQLSSPYVRGLDEDGYWSKKVADKWKTQHSFTGGQS